MVAVVLVPVVLGVALRALLPSLTRRIEPVAPLVSILFVVLIVSGIVARSRDLISEHAGGLLLALLLLHVTGFALGYIVTRALRFEEDCARTISIEVGMQNSGLGSTLASSPSFAAQFANPLQAALAPVPSAISAVYHVVIGSLLASIWRRRSEKED